MSTYASFQAAFSRQARHRRPSHRSALARKRRRAEAVLKTDVLEHYESQTGQRSLDHRMVKQKSATVNLTIEEFTKENLALALYGNHVVGTPGTGHRRPIGGGARRGRRPLLLGPPWKVSSWSWWIRRARPRPDRARTTHR